MTLKTILIVDDEKLNRVILKQLFDDSYTVLEAADGVEALQIIKDNRSISFIMLDLHMPNLDGLGVLEQMRADPELSQIPVIIVTSKNDKVLQRRALALGALDVITKPLDTTIVQLRVDRLVSLIDASRLEEENKWLKELMHISEIDALTGLWNKETFCRETKKMLLANPGKKYALARWDIDRFKVFNDTFGTDAGDTLLKNIGTKLLCTAKKKAHHCTVGYYDADHFVYCIEKDSIAPEVLYNDAQEILCSCFPNYSFSVHFGFYDIDDTSLDVGVMCDRALLALRSIKNDYTIHFAWYSDKMRIGIIEEQEISSMMKDALNDGQFIVYFQPQYNYQTGVVVGAEALVRWRHPEKEIIPPNKFIPVFEKNGFISELDQYVWDSVCSHIKSWRDKGLVIPSVSVNVSRRDLYLPGLADLLCGIIKKHGLIPSDLHLEITESAYVDNPDLLINTVKELQQRGFIVEMDDFGSGYSSLNTLKDVPVDMLKLDMAFLSQGDKHRRGGSILSAVVSMAHSINLRIIAEGVETRRQADYLKSVGCLLMQGYLFAKPMSADEFETVICGNTADSITMQLSGVDNSVDFLDSTTQSTLLFNSFLGGAGILEYRGGNIAALRLNDRFFEVINVSREEYIRLQYNLIDTVAKEDRKAFVSMFERAIDSNGEADCEIKTICLKKNARPIYLRCMARCLATRPGSYVFYLSIENITKRINYEHQNDIYGNIIKNLPMGVAVFELGKKLTSIYINDNVCKMFGYSKKDCGKYLSRFATVCFADSKNRFVREKYERLLEGEIIDIDRIHAVRKDGTKFWMRAVMHSATDGHGRTLIYTSIIDMTDVVNTENSINEQRREMSALIAHTPCGISRIARKGDSLCIEYISRGLCDILGFENSELFQLMKNRDKSIVHPDDIESAEQFYQDLISGVPFTEADLRLRNISGNYIWLHINCNYLADSATSGVCYIAYSDVSETRRLQNQMKQDKQQIETLINSIPGGIASYEVQPDRFHLLYASDGVAAMSGRTPEEYRSLIIEKKKTDIYELDEAEVITAIRSAVETGEELDINFRIRHKNGSLIWVNMRGKRSGTHNSFPVMQVVFHNLSVTTKLYRTIIDKFDSALFVADCQTHELLFANSAAEKLSGFSKESAIGKRCYEYIKKQPAVCADCKLKDAPVGYEMIENDRRYYVNMWRINWNGRNAFVVAMSDRTELYTTQEQLVSVLKNIPGGIAVFRIDGENVFREFTSEKAKKLLGYRSDEIVDTVVSQDNPHVHTDDREKVMRALKTAIHGNGVFSCDFRALQPDGSYRWTNLIANPVSVDGNILYYGIYSDVQERIYETLRIRSEQKNVLRAALNEAESSKRDAATGIYTRITAESIIESKLASFSSDDSCALVLLDMDNLKNINDSFGHLQGDRALKSIADTLKKHFRSTDIVGRYGGDELIVFMPGISNRDSLCSSLRMLNQKLAKIHIGEHDEHAIHCSIGCAFGKGGDKLKTLYKHADTALYHVKRNGKNGFAVYDSKMLSQDYTLPGYSVAQHEELSIGKSEFLRLIDSVSFFYTYVISINVSQNSYFFLENGRHIADIPTEGTYSEFLKSVIPFVMENDRKKFAEQLSFHALFDDYKSRRAVITFRTCKTKANESYVAEANIVFYKNEAGDICAFAFIRPAKKENG